MIETGSIAGQRQGQSFLYPRSATGNRLKVLLVVPPVVPRWINSFIRLAAGSRHMELSALVVEGLPEDPPEALALDMHACLWLESLRRRHAVSLVHPESIDGTHLVACLETNRVSAPEGLRNQIEQMQPDFVLSSAPLAWAEAWSDCGSRSCWTFSPDVMNSHSAGLALLTPILKHEVVTEVGFELRSPQQQPVRLESGWATTAPVSFDLQRDTMFLKLPALLMRALRRIATGNGLMQLPATGSLCLAGTAPASAFGVGLRALRIAFIRTMRARSVRRRPELPWFLLTRNGSDFLDPDNPVSDSTSAMVAPRDDYWADPCLVAHDNRRFVFVEEFAMTRNIGLIACLELLPDGTAARLGFVLDEPHHLSYPSIFKWKDDFYMTVESGEAGRVTLYKALDFPLEWDRVADLLEGWRCVDPTLHFHDGHWYLFANVSESGGGTSDELFLFVSDELSGPYLPHPCNPIVTDVRCARPAGRLFEHTGRLVRPAQSCAPTYGAAIVFNEIVELTPTHFREREISRLEPDWSNAIDGCHTYSRSGSTEVIDVHGQPPDEGQRMTVASAMPSSIRSMSNPLVSAIMPAYNAERFLVEAIESALSQSFESLEVIIVNDGSKDATGDIADRYAAAYPGRVRVVHQENKGLPFARNAAISIARGKYLALLDADDVWLPTHIESCVTLLENDPELGLVHANDETIDTEGTPLGSQGGRWKKKSEDAYAAILLRKQHVNCPTAVFRKSIVEAIGPFDGLFNRLGCEDRDMWLRLAEVSRLCYIDEVQALYRMHGNNMSSNREVMSKARHALVDKHGGRLRGRHLKRKALAAIYADLGHELARENPRRLAFGAFLQALKHDPLRMDAWKGLVRRAVIGRRP